MAIDGQPREVPGTYAYMAPEILQIGESSITKCSDIWAVGCIGLALCLGQRLSRNAPLLRKHVNHGRGNPATLEELIASIPSRFEDGVRMVLRYCLAWEPRRRCTAMELRDHLLQRGRQ